MLLDSLGWIKFWQILLSALTTAGFVGAVLGSGPIGGAAGMLVSVSLLCLNAYTKNYDLGELAQKHKEAANGLWLIREKYQSLLADVEMKEKPLEWLQTQRDDLVEQLSKIYSAAPGTNAVAYKKAQEALQIREDMIFTTEEIDAFLPGVLRKGTKSEAAGVERPSSGGKSEARGG